MYKIKAESADEWRAEADKARAGAAKFKKDAEILEMEVLIPSRFSTYQ